MPKSKLLPAILLVVLLAFLGLFVGTMIGGLFFVPPGSGLAGPAIALGYGFWGLVIALAVGTMLARKLSHRQLRSALLGAGVASMAPIGFLVYRIWTTQMPANDSAGSPSPYQSPYQLHLRVTNSGLNSPNNPLPFREVRVEQSATLRQMQIISAAPNPQVCRGQLQPLEGVDISSALKDVAAMVVGSMRGCTHGTTGVPLYHLKWNLTGFGDALSEGSLAITADCLVADESPGELIELLSQIYARLSSGMECEPYHIDGR